jgi:carbon-monoxide dehydrogenase medium subunit
MKPRSFDYVAAATLDHAIAALAESGGDAKILAGGQSLVPMMNFRLVAPPTLVDINGIAGLAGIREHGDGTAVGALTRHRALETSDVVRRKFPVVHEAMRHVAHLAVRNRGTIGGSLAHADPAAELPAMCVLLDARLTARGSSGTRAIDATDFFVAPLTTSLADDEILTEIRFPTLPPATGWGFEEFSRRHGDFAVAGAAVTLTVSSGVVARARLALMGVDQRPIRVPAAEAMLIGREVDRTLAEAAASAVRDAVRPMTDLHASADFRRHLAGVLSRRVIEAAWARAVEHPS